MRARCGDRVPNPGGGGRRGRAAETRISVLVARKGRAAETRVEARGWGDGKDEAGASAMRGQMGLQMSSRAVVVAVMVAG